MRDSARGGAVTRPTSATRLDAAAPAGAAGAVAASRTQARCQAHRLDPLWRRGPGQHARPLPQPAGMVSCRRVAARARAPARRCPRQRAEEPRGPAADLPAGEPRLGLREPELPAASRGAVARSRRRRQEGHRLASRARPRIRRRPDRIFLAGGCRRARSWRPSPRCRRPIRASSLVFEHADTAVRAAVSLYYHGRRDGSGDAWAWAPNRPPCHHRRWRTSAPDAPPFFVAHGDRRYLAAGQGRCANSPRPCARDRAVRPSTPSCPARSTSIHLFHSVRCTAVTNGIEAFAAWVLRG